MAGNSGKSQKEGQVLFEQGVSGFRLPGAGSRICREEGLAGGLSAAQSLLRIGNRFGLRELFVAARGGVRRPSWRAFCGPKPPRNRESFWAAGNISRGPWGVSLGLGCGKKVCGPPKNSAARAEAHPWWAAGKIPRGPRAKRNRETIWAAESTRRWRC